MTSGEFVQVMQQRWRTTVGVGLVVVLAALLAALFTPKHYTSSLLLYVSTQQQQSNTESAYQGSLLSQQRVKSYVELLQDRRVASDVVGRLGLADSPEHIGDEISASAGEDTVLIRVEVSDPDADRSAAIANTAGDSFIRLVAELEQPSSPAGQPPIVLRVVQPAVPVYEATSPNVALYLLFGALLGVILGVGAGLIRNATDSGIDSRSAFEDAIQSPLLGVSFVQNRRDPIATSTPVKDQPGSVDSEAYRKIQAGIQFLDADHPVKSFVVTSALPSEGKTTTASNLALSASAAGSRVVIVDADLRRPRVAGVFGVDGSVGLTSVLSRRAEVRHVIQPSGFAGLDVLASGPLPPNPGALLGSERMHAIVLELVARYDCVIIDSAPVLPAADTSLLVPNTDGVLVVARHGVTPVSALEGVRGGLASVRARILGGVMTFHPRARTGAYGIEQYTYDKSSAADGVAGDSSTTTIRSVDSTTRRDPGGTRADSSSTPCVGVGMSTNDRS